MPVQTYIVGILVFVMGTLCNAQTKIYKLTLKTTNADFNYVALNNLDSTMQALGEMQTPDDLKLIKQLFKPVKGEFNVYEFMAVYPSSDAGGYYHNILIIKTNHQNKIIDALQYNLEWPEIPCCYAPYKYLKKHKPGDIFLTDKLSIIKLKLTRTCYSCLGVVNMLKDSGVISLKKTR